MKPFKKAIYVTKPVFPKLEKFSVNLEYIWKAQWLSNNGKIHNQLEEKLTEYLKVPYLSLSTNGTIALLIALKALDIKGQVITTPFTFAATVHAIKWSGLEPIFCDIDPISMNINPKLIEKAITPRTSAILPVHVYGTPCDVNTIKKIAKKHNLKVIYDAAHAFGTEIGGNGIGNYGDITMFSFHATKLFHTAEGGALVCKEKKLKEKVDLLKNFGIENEEEVILPGINGKMNELQAAMGLSVLELVDGERKKRRKISEIYKIELGNIEGIDFLPYMPNIKKSYQYFIIRINEKRFGKSRDYIYEELKKYNVFTRKYFYPLCSNFDFYKNLQSARAENLPIANTISNQVLSLPFYGSLKEEEIRIICKIIKESRN